LNTSSVSFIIPHKGREAFLQETLKSIIALETAESIEVVIVTQNSELSAETLAAQRHLRLQVVYADSTLTISALRNIGVRATASEYLAFLDADIALSPDWLNTLLPLLENEQVVLVSAMQRCSELATPLEIIRTTLSNAVLDAPVDFLPGRNLLLARKTFYAVGGFPENLVTCEDYYFTDKVGELGTMWYSSATSYIHLGEDQHYGEMFSKEIWRGQSNLQSLQGRTIKSSELPSFVVPPWITFMAILTLGFVLVEHSFLATVTGVSAGLPFAAYVTRLYFLASGRVSLRSIIGFYSYYFPARTWGTMIGVFRGLGHDLHDN
jgi:glycosyltransferase involved in cell wall biosynthesis